MSKLISTFQIRFDDETKAEISELKNKLNEVNERLNARDKGLWLESKRKCNSRIGQIMADAISSQIKEILRPDGLLKEMSPPDGLLKAMQAEAANDAPQPKLKHLGQWVFEGQDEKFESASVRQDGFAALWSCKSDKLSPAGADFLPFGKPIIYSEPLGYGFDATNWQKSAINRLPVNDVEYLTEIVPTIQPMDAREIIIDELWPDKPVPQITQADMQLIFIKNLSETLIQRMHSMNRFSEDDYAIGGDKLMAWDIVIGRAYKSEYFGVVFAQQHSSKEHLNKVDVILLEPKGSHGMIAAFANIYFTDNDTYRTITEDELPAFRAALEACYA